MSKSVQVERLIRPLILTLLMILLGFGVNIAQSHTVSRFLADHTPSQKLFFYPSTLRMMNVQKNPDFYALVRDVDKLRVLLYDKNSSGFTSQTLRALSQDVEKEEYQELMIFQTPKQKAYLYSLGEDDAPEGVVGLIETDDSLILTDLEGFVNLPALLKLFQSDFNFEDVAGLVDIASQLREEMNKDGQQ